MQPGDQPSRHRWSRPGLADVIIGAHGLASFCYGMVFPYTAIYLAAKPGVGTGGVVVYYAFSGSANLAATLLLAAGWIRLPRVALGVLGNAAWLVGYLIMSVAGSYPLVIVAAAAIGAGQGCFLAAVIPILNSLIAPENRRRVFGRRYAILNATLAGGSLVAGLIVALGSRAVIPYFFLVNAIGIIPTAMALLLAGRRRIPGADPEPGFGGGGMPTFALWKLAGGVVVFQLAVYLLGFSQFEATGPLVARRLMHLPLFSVSLMLTLSVLTVAVAQRTVTRLLEHRPERTGLRIGVALWVVAYCVVGLLAFASPGARLAGLLSYAVLFALGECAYSCSFYPWLISVVPDAELPRANALANSAMGIGTFVGPSIGVSLALSGSAPVVWLTLAAACTVVIAATTLMTRRSQLASAVPVEAAGQAKG